jgi:hypothetical protein
MGVRHANQHLTVFVSTNAAGFADAVPGTADDLLNDGVFAPGRVTYQTNIGTNYATRTAALAGAGADGATYTVVYKDLNGDIFRSPLIRVADEIAVKEGTASAAPTEQVDAMQIAASVTAGDEYILRLAVPNYAEMISQQDEVYFYGSYVAKTGNTADDVATGLHASLKARLDSLPTPIANATVATDTVTVTGLAQPYVQSKFDGKQVNFHLTLASPDSLLSDRTAHTAPNPGAGTYNQVASMEEFYAGYASDWLNRTADFPGDGNPTFAAAAGNTYVSDVITFDTKHDAGATVGKQSQTVMVFLQE